MKKILVVLLSLTLIFAFTGCTSSNNGAAEDIEIKTHCQKKACQGTLQCRCLWGWSGSDGLYRYDFLRWYYS